MTLASTRITIDPSICHSKPCIRGMRYPVETVLEWLAAGMDIGDILSDYPDLGMCSWLSSCGHDALHTFDLDGRILVTRDDDFVQSRLVRGRPRLLWLIATGNVDNRRLEAMVRAALPLAQRAIGASSFIELGPDRLTIRE